MSNKEVNDVTCSKCKQVMSNGEVFCTNCGTKIGVVVNEPLVQKFCTNCGDELSEDEMFCNKCGTKAGTNAGNTKVVGKVGLSASDGEPFSLQEFPLYNFTEEQIVTNMINTELSKLGEDDNISTKALEGKKNIFTIIFTIIVFLCVSLYFFHTGRIWLYLILGIATIIYFKVVSSYNMVKFLKKEIKARPDEKISYIVASVVSGKINGTSFKFLRIGIVLIGILLPLFIFSSNRIIYEQDGDGYVVRFYTIGSFHNEEELVIPEKYKDKPVIGIRGDVFANVKTLRKVELPDTIKYIRGGAFMNASNLEEINLPEGIPEIKGDTFNGCTNLKEITIPDSVTRIGGSAFRYNHNLEHAYISENSKLKSIGSSAFRDCYKLKEIYLPKGVIVDIRSFKNSPTVRKEYGTIDEETGFNKEYSRFVYMKVNEEAEINPYYSNANLQGAYLKVVKIVEIEKYQYEVYFEYRDDNGTVTFSLNKNSDYKLVNDKFGIQVYNLFNNAVSFDAYFN